MAQYRRPKVDSNLSRFYGKFSTLAYIYEKHVIILGEVSGQLSQLSFRSV